MSFGDDFHTMFAAHCFPTIFCNASSSIGQSIGIKTRVIIPSSIASMQNGKSGGSIGVGCPLVHFAQRFVQSNSDNT
eukprot:5756998-Amphidinium_carterae.2